jgi:nitrite reductase/ring-hydroxylating ferredoxin subunit
MLRAEDNKFLTESGAGTPMGPIVAPFLAAGAVVRGMPEPDGEPKKIIVMGEELLAFRDSRGVVGVIDQYCPHRDANLWLGRNEECGIRCIYHGWKFNTDGTRVGMPTSYPDLNAKDKIRIKSYPVREWGEMIWPIWVRRARCRTCLIWRWCWCRPRTATSRRNGRAATGCRPWRARSTPPRLGEGPSGDRDACSGPTWLIPIPFASRRPHST